MPQKQSYPRFDEMSPEELRQCLVGAIEKAGLFLSWHRNLIIGWAVSEHEVGNRLTERLCRGEKDLTVDEKLAVLGKILEAAEWGSRWIELLGLRRGRGGKVAAGGASRASQTDRCVAAAVGDTAACGCPGGPADPPTGSPAGRRNNHDGGVGSRAGTPANSRRKK